MPCRTETDRLTDTSQASDKYALGYTIDIHNARPSKLKRISQAQLVILDQNSAERRALQAGLGSSVAVSWVGPRPRIFVVMTVSLKSTRLVIIHVLFQQNLDKRPLTQRPTSH